MDTLFIIQLIGFVGTGGFVGEFYRTTKAGDDITRIFLANFLAGSFLSFMTAYLFYLTTGKEAVSLFLGGLLSYQDERFLTKLVRKFLENMLRGGDFDDK